MDLHALNRRKNIWLRNLKTRLACLLLDKKCPAIFTPKETGCLRQIVLLRSDNKLGDMIIMSAVIRELKKQLPQVQISVIAGPNSATILQHNPYVTHVYIAHNTLISTWKLGRLLCREKIDLFVNFDTEHRASELFLLRVLSPRFAFGLNTQKIHLYNLTAPITPNSHITQIYRTLFNVLHLPFTHTAPELFIAPTAKRKAKQFLQSIPKPRVSVNLFAASKHRSLSTDQLELLLKHFPDVSFILLGSLPQRRLIKKYRWPTNLYFPPENFDLDQLLALLGQTQLLISPDTMWVHAATALNTPQICFFKQSDPQNQQRWRPLTKEAKIVQSPDEFSQLDISCIFPFVKKFLNSPK